MTSAIQPTFWLHARAILAIAMIRVDGIEQGSFPVILGCVITRILHSDPSDHNDYIEKHRENILETCLNRVNTFGGLLAYRGNSTGYRKHNITLDVAEAGGELVCAPGQIRTMGPPQHRYEV